ncbi:MAG: hypothetical protein HY074_12165 [Deltaproteobacteria bacterium]|nr:hypothetical protein [Deltaproteobacteria bacterium]
MNSKLILLCATLLATLASGCISGEVIDQAICVTQADLSFPGAPIIGLQGTTQQSFEMDLSSQLKQLDVGGASTDGSSINIVSVTLTAKTGVTDFAFINTLTGTVTSEVNASLAPELVIDYNKGSATSVPSPLELPADATINLFPMLNAGKVNVALDVSGTIPSTAWSADLVVCFAIDLKLKKNL